MFQPVVFRRRMAADLPSRVPSLDGLRAVSIVLVLLAHMLFSIGSRNSRLTNVAIELGSFGVGVFFVISGFVITHLLLKEADRTGGISLRNFYARRSFRILPAYYTLLLVVLILQRVHLLGLPTRDILAAGTFTWNYSRATNTWLAHTWSLCVEEQFYLFWPATLWLLGAKRATVVALSLLVLAPAGRLAAMTLLPPDHYLVDRIGILGHARIDTIMFGCVAALMLGDDRFRRGILRFMDPLGIWLAGGCLIASVLLSQFNEFYWKSVGLWVEGACVTLLVVWLLCRPEGWAGRLLNQRAMVHIGVVSFSLIFGSSYS